MQRQKGEIEKKEGPPIKKSQPSHQERGSFYIKIKVGKRVVGHFRIFAREVRGKAGASCSHFLLGNKCTKCEEGKGMSALLRPPAEERQLC